MRDAYMPRKKGPQRRFAALAAVFPAFVVAAVGVGAAAAQCHTQQKAQIYFARKNWTKNPASCQRPA